MKLSAAAGRRDLSFAQRRALDLLNRGPLLYRRGQWRSAAAGKSVRMRTLASLARLGAARTDVRAGRLCRPRVATITATGRATLGALCPGELA